MIDFSTLKELYVDGKKVTSLFLDGHEVPVGGETPKYFTVTALEQDATVSINKVGSPPDFSLEYSTDGNMWSSYSAAQSIALLAGKSVMFRRVGEATTTFSSGSSKYWKFVFSSHVKVSGNIMSLLDASMQSTTVGSYAFCRMFNGNNNLVDASELVLAATTLASNCYVSMFSGCTSLATAPTLPATILATSCYAGMFYGCSSLKTAPVLPATTLANSCYYQMFYECTSLIVAPVVLPATALIDNSYKSMFERCAFTTAPLLCATSIASNSISYMLNHCSNLSSISVNWTSWNGTNNWVENVTGFGEFHCTSALGTDETIQRGNAYCPPNFIVGNYDVDGSLMSNAAVRTSYATAFLEDGSSHCPTASSLSVFNGNTCQLLVDNIDYTIAFPSDTTTAGVKTITFNGTGSYSGTKTFTYEIFARDLSNCTKSIGPVYDDEGPLYTTIVQPETGYTLVEGTDYTVAVSTSGSQSTVTVTGIGSWSGTYTTTVAYKTSGTTPLAVYKNDPNESGDVAVKLVNYNGPVVDMQVKGMTNGTWQKMEYDTMYSDPAGLLIRAADMNNNLATSDSNCNVFDFNSINFSNGCSVGLSGHLESLLDRTQQLTSIDTDSALNRTFRDPTNMGQQKLVDASKLEIKPMLLKSSKSIVGLFQNCTALTAVPDFTGLSTVGNKQWAFVENFKGCTSLSSASYTLPWLTGQSQTKDSNGLYQFRDDTSMTDFTLHSHFGDGRVCDDSLSSTNLYFNRLMLQNCSQLTCISTDISSWPYNGFENWVQGVAAAGTFICPTALGTDATIQRGASYCPTGWTVVNYDAT